MSCNFLQSAQAAKQEVENIFPPDPFWHQHSKIRTVDPIMQMN